MQLHPDHFQLGTLVRTHGVKGDFLALLDTDSPGRYKKLNVVYLEVDDVLKEYNVTKITVQERERTAKLHLQGIEDMRRIKFNFILNQLFIYFKYFNPKVNI